MTGTNGKLFGVLLGGSILSTIAVIPYLLTLQAPLLGKLSIPLHVLLAAQIIQSIILFAVCIFLGLRAARSVGLGTPILESLIEGNIEEAGHRFKSILSTSVGAGVSVAAFIIGADLLFSASGAPIPTLFGLSPQPPAWQGLLASFYGGVSEEILMRLFLMSALVWASYKIKRVDENTPTKLGVWLAIAITAIIFGVGHLPLTASLTEITPLVIFRALTLNGIAGIVFGWLYWKKGLGSAMLSHFSADIVLHALLPML